MIESNCRNCQFYDNCAHRRLCDNYSPIGEEAEDEYIERHIEKEREEFNAVWRVYASEYSA